MRVCDVTGGFSAMRAIRVMRLFKLLRFFPTMGVQLTVMTLLTHPYLTLT